MRPAISRMRSSLWRRTQERSKLQAELGVLCIMSFNLTLVTTRYAICVTDRRLTSLDGKIISERSNKLTCFQCADGHGFITYTGIGQDEQRQTPSDWISDVQGLGGLPVDELAAALQSEGTRRLAKLSKFGANARHTFVVAGFRQQVPFVFFLSNFESLEERGCAAPIWPELRFSGLHMSAVRTSPHPYCLVSTGANNLKPTRSRRAIVQMVREGVPPQLICKRMIKTVRDVAYQSSRLGTVGTSVNSGIVGLTPQFDIDCHIPGGTRLLEGANYISPHMTVKDFYVDTSANPKFRYSRISRGPKIEEPICSTCGSPVPEGYSKCGVCDARI